MAYQGGCHCGRTKFEVEGTIDQVIQCNCSICQSRGYLLWMVPRDKLKMKTSMDELNTYKFHKKQIEHKFCPTCGSAPFGLGTSPKGESSAAINVRCLENVNLDSLKKIPFDGRSY